MFITIVIFLARKMNFAWNKLISVDFVDIHLSINIVFRFMNTNYEMKLILLFIKLYKLNFCLLCMTLFVTISLPRKNKVNICH